MEDLQVVRRTRMVKTSISYKQPTMKVEAPKGRFFFTRQASYLMRLEEGSGVMFGFNYGEKKCYIFKDNEIDSFRLRSANKGSSLRFTAKDLVEHFKKCFDMEDGSAYFEVKKDDDFRFILKPIN